MEYQYIRDAIKENGFHSMQNSESVHLAGMAKQEFVELMPNLPIHSPAEPFLRTALLERPWRKMAIGSKNGLGESYAQFLDTTYFSERGLGTQNISAFFDYLILFRNKILKLDKNFGRWDSDGSYWNASRIHHYPAGGGFMAEHSDTYFPKVLNQSQIPFLQVMGLMSSRGIDFESGGGFIAPAYGERIFFEDESSMGKIVMFDGSIRHGVDDIDSHKVLDLQGTSGRYAAFVNLYEKR